MERFYGDDIQSLSLEEHLGYQKAASEILMDMEDHSMVDVLDPTSVLCNRINCPYRNDAFLYYADDNHLAPNRAMDLVPLLRQYFD